MKSVLLLILISSSILVSKPKTTARSQVIINDILESNDSKKSSAELLEINSELYIPIIATIKKDYIDSHKLGRKFKIGSQYSKYITLYLKADQLSELIDSKAIESFEISERSDEPHIQGAAIDSKADLVHEGISMPSGYTGDGVIVGIIDGGFDFTHPNFYDSTGNKYRILAAWDQRTEGNPPPGYEFGTAYYGKNELLDAKRDTEEIQERWGTHGTHVAGIAGGSGAGISSLKGVAYECDFIFCTKTDGDSGLFDAFNWMNDVAKAEGKRLVINMSFGGLHHGTRDGTNPLGGLMKELQENEGVIFVGSAGNNGNNDFHLMRDFKGDTLKTWLRQSNSHEFWGNRIVAIGEIGKPFSAKIRLRDYSDFQLVLNETDFISTNDGRIEIDTFMVGEIGVDTLFYRMIIEKESPFSQRPRIDLFIKQLNSKRITLNFSSADGVLHVWNVLQREEDQTSNLGGRFSRFGSFEEFEVGDSHYGLGEPGLNDAVITVAAHSHSDKKLTSFSSEGPRIDGTIKPDISAPGFQVVSSIAKFVAQNYQATALSEFNGENYSFAPLSGTSMSAPLVAGICALILEAKPDITGAELKAVLKATASQDNFTGDIPEEGSVEWGAGKVDAFSAVLDVLEIINDLEIDTQNNLLIYPNPADNYLKIIGIEKGVYFEIINSNGKTIVSGKYENNIDISSLTSGAYFLKTDNSISKFVRK